MKPGGFNVVMKRGQHGEKNNACLDCQVSQHTVRCVALNAPVSDCVVFLMLLLIFCFSNENDLE